MRTLATLILSGLTACTFCDPKPVPFGLDPAKQTPSNAAPPASTPPVEEGQTHASGTRRIVLDGHPLTVGRGSIRAALAGTPSRGSHPDAWVITESDEGLKLSYASRTDQGYGTLRELMHHASEKDCQLREAKLQRLGSRYGVAQGRWDCSATSRERQWIFLIQRPPRLLERLEWVRAHTSSQTIPSLAFGTSDEDGDGHSDLVVRVTFSTTEAGKTQTTVPLIWLDRPSGLARDPTEPARTLDELAQAAQTALTADTRRAKGIAQTVQRLHTNLCQGHNAILWVGSDASEARQGLDCKADAASARATAVEAVAHLRAGNLAAGLDAAGRAEEGDALDTAMATVLKQAFTAMANKNGRTSRTGPAVETHAGSTDTPPLGFRPDGLLVVGGQSPFLLDPDTLEKVGVAPTWAKMTDPSGRFAVIGVTRNCSGYVAQVVRASEILAQRVLGRAIHEPLIEPRESPPGHRCDEPGASPAEPGGWQVLGWAPQGIVVARVNDVRILPMAADGRPAGEATRLKSDQPLPHPLAPGPAAPDGRGYALATRWGVIVRTLTRGGPRLELVQPKIEAQSRVHAAALGPDGSLAWIQGGRVHVASAPPLRR